MHVNPKTWDYAKEDLVPGGHLKVAGTKCREVERKRVRPGGTIENGRIGLKCHFASSSVHRSSLAGRIAF